MFFGNEVRRLENMLVKGYCVSKLLNVESNEQKFLLPYSQNHGEQNLHGGSKGRIGCIS